MLQRAVQEGNSGSPFLFSERLVVPGPVHQTLRVARRVALVWRCSRRGGRGDRGSGASARAVRGRARKSTGESTRCRWRSCSARSWSPWAAREFAPERLRERERHRVGAFRFPECRGGRSASQHRDHARWWPPHARVSRSSEIRARTKRHTLDLGGGGQRSVRGRRGRSTSSFAARYGAGGASFPRSPSIN